MIVRCFRKKPMVVQAVLVERGMLEIAADWCGGKVQCCPHGDKKFIKVPTLEGVLSANVGDMIIKGVVGEFYPCKPDIFAQTYEPICNWVSISD